MTLTLALLAGCATTNQAQELAGTSWEVVRINGQSAAGLIQFDPEQFQAYFECNRMQGSYRWDGEVLRAGPIARTEMACDSAFDDGASPMADEQRALAVLAGVMRLVWQGSQSLALRSGGGEIELVRQREP